MGQWSLTLRSIRVADVCVNLVGDSTSWVKPSSVIVESQRERGRQTDRVPKKFIIASGKQGNCLPLFTDGLFNTAGFYMTTVWLLALGFATDKTLALSILTAVMGFHSSTLASGIITPLDIAPRSVTATFLKVSPPSNLSRHLFVKVSPPSNLSRHLFVKVSPPSNLSSHLFVKVSPLPTSVVIYLLKYHPLPTLVVVYLLKYHPLPTLVVIYLLKYHPLPTLVVVYLLKYHPVPTLVVIYLLKYHPLPTLVVVYL